MPSRCRLSVRFLSSNDDFPLLLLFELVWVAFIPLLTLLFSFGLIFWVWFLVSIGCNAFEGPEESLFEPIVLLSLCLFESLLLFVWLLLVAWLLKRPFNIPEIMLPSLDDFRVELALLVLLRLALLLLGAVITVAVALALVVAFIEDLVGKLSDAFIIVVELEWAFEEETFGFDKSPFSLGAWTIVCKTPFWIPFWPSITSVPWPFVKGGCPFIMLLLFSGITVMLSSAKTFNIIEIIVLLNININAFE